MTWVYAGSVSPERRYQLQNAEANQQIDALLERLRVPGSPWRLESELVTTALKLFEDGAAIADLKIANAALKELRYGFKVFAPYRSVPKVTVFGSARTPADHTIADAGPRVRQAHDRVRDGWSSPGRAAASWARPRKARGASARSA